MNAEYHYAECHQADKPVRFAALAPINTPDTPMRFQDLTAKKRNAKLTVESDM